jgi:hypothetical protein
VENLAGEMSPMETKVRLLIIRSPKIAAIHSGKVRIGAMKEMDGVAMIVHHQNTKSQRKARKDQILMILMILWVHMIKTPATPETIITV